MTEELLEATTRYGGITSYIVEEGTVVEVHAVRLTDANSYVQLTLPEEDLVDGDSVPDNYELVGTTGTREMAEEGGLRDDLSYTYAVYAKPDGSSWQLVELTNYEEDLAGKVADASEADKDEFTELEELED